MLYTIAQVARPLLSRVTWNFIKPLVVLTRLDTSEIWLFLPNFYIRLATRSCFILCRQQCVKLSTESFAHHCKIVFYVGLPTGYAPTIWTSVLTYGALQMQTTYLLTYLLTTEERVTVFFADVSTDAKDRRRARSLPVTQISAIPVQARANIWKLFTSVLVRILWAPEFVALLRCSVRLSGYLKFCGCFYLFIYLYILFYFNSKCRSPWNFATYGIYVLLYNLRSKTFVGFLQKIGNQQRAKFGMISSNFRLYSPISTAHINISKIVKIFIGSDFFRARKKFG